MLSRTQGRRLGVGGGAGAESDEVDNVSVCSFGLLDQVYPWLPGCLTQFDPAPSCRHVNILWHEWVRPGDGNNSFREESSQTSSLMH